MERDISFAEAAALAEAGSAEAQYALSGNLHQLGRFDESLHWLGLASAQALVPAQLTLAAFLLDGRHCQRDLPGAIALLQPLAPTQVEANLLLGELHGFGASPSADPRRAMHYLFAAARLGDSGARRQLAMLCVCHHRWEWVQPLLDAAAANFDWPSLEGMLPQLAADIALPAAEVLHHSPLIRKFPAVFHPLVLDFVINLAAPLVRRSQIVDARTGEVRADPMRSSSHVTFGPRQHDHVLEAIERCISRVTGVPTANGEFLQILRYRVGEEFRPHVDYFNESAAGSLRSLADGGQRAQTVLVYLNDAYQGGGTAFPALQLEIKARPGDLLHFHNLGQDGLGHRDSLHAGLPVTAGEKWLLSQWIRSESYPARLAW